MSDAPHDRGLQMPADHFHRRSWTAQRVGWVLMLLVIVAALAGLFGRGPLSQRTIGERGAPLRLEYDRFPRLEAPTRLRAEVGPTAGREGVARLWIDRAYLAAFRVTSVTPQPEATEAGPDRLVYMFKLPTANGPTGVVFDLHTRSTGSISGRAGIVGGPTLTFRQFVYP